MPTAYEKVLAKYEWAKQHVNQLESAIDDFRSANPHSIATKHDNQRDEITYHLTAVPVIPDHIGLMLGDAIHNLRTTLDHLAWALVAEAGGTLDEHTSFPISNLSKDFKSVMGSRVKGLGEHCRKAIERVQPYPDGRGRWAWQLHHLDIIDKHQLVPTVTTVPVGRTMMPSEKKAFDRRESLIGPHAHAAIQYTSAANSPTIRAVQAGDILGTFRFSEVQEDMGFSFDVAVYEPEIISLIPACFLLKWLSAEVRAVINELACFL
ncbi:MAG: hypothetical protein WBM14_11130 [Terracidiphilus sp.]|jgi:hypothetical protein